VRAREDVEDRDERANGGIGGGNKFRLVMFRKAMSGSCA